MSIKIEGMDRLMEDLDKLDPRSAKSVVGKATADAAKKVIKPKVQAATPWRSYRKAVTAGAAKRNKPAGMVKYNPKKAPFRHIMIGGSKAHSTARQRSGKSDVQSFTASGMQAFSRGHMVSGVKGTPVIDQVADRYGDDALDHVADYLGKHFGLDK